MQVQINTDRNITGDEASAARMRDSVEEALSRVGDAVTRVEVHLSDQEGSGRSTGQETRCMMEARLERREPLVVTHSAATADRAIEGAAGKLARVIQRAVGRTRDRRDPQRTRLY